MLIPQELSKSYYNFIKTKCFIDDIKSADKVVELFVKADIKFSKSLIDVTRFDDKSKKLLVDLLNETKLDSKVSKFVDSVPFKSLESIDLVIEKCLDDFKSDFEEISTKIVQVLVLEYPFVDHYVEEIKDEIKKLLSTKISHSLYKREKIVSLNFEDFDYKQQIKNYTDFVEEMIDKRIKSITITLMPGTVIVQGTGTATNGSPLVFNDVVS